MKQWRRLSTWWVRCWMNRASRSSAQGQSSSCLQVSYLLQGHSCRVRLSGGCANCKRMWQLLELLSRMYFLLRFGNRSQSFVAPQNYSRFRAQSIPKLLLLLLLLLGQLDVTILVDIYIRMIISALLRSDGTLKNRASLYLYPVSSF